MFEDLLDEAFGKRPKSDEPKAPHEQAFDLARQWTYLAARMRWINDYFNKKEPS